MRFLSGLAVLALLAQASTGVFELDTWPGEGRPVFQAVAPELALRELPSPSARIVRQLRVSIGQQLGFDETRYRTTEAGRLEVLPAETNITGRLLGPIRLLTRAAYSQDQFPEEVLACKGGELIEYLQDEPEGACFVRVAGQVVDVDACPARDSRTFRLIARPKIEWWIRIVLDGVPVGWVIVDGKAVKESGRSL